jgi:hypothetical protein
MNNNQHIAELQYLQLLSFCSKKVPTGHNCQHHIPGNIYNIYNGLFHRRIGRADNKSFVRTLTDEIYKIYNFYTFWVDVRFKEKVREIKKKYILYNIIFTVNNVNIVNRCTPQSLCTFLEAKTSWRTVNIWGTIVNIHTAIFKFTIFTIFTVLSKLKSSAGMAAFVAWRGSPHGAGNFLPNNYVGALLGEKNQTVRETILKKSTYLRLG